MTPQIEALTESLRRLHEKVDRLIAQTAPKCPSEDEKIFRDPSEKYWNGPSYKGCKLSEAPADYLRAYAQYKRACAYMGKKDKDPKKQDYATRDEVSALLALDWAEYREATTVDDQPRNQTEEQQEFTGEDGGIPF